MKETKIIPTIIRLPESMRDKARELTGDKDISPLVCETLRARISGTKVKQSETQKESMIRLAVKIPETLKRKARKLAVNEIGENNLNAYVRFLLNEKINQK